MQSLDGLLALISSPVKKKKNAWRNETLSWRIDSDTFVFGKFEVQISNTELENQIFYSANKENKIQ